MTALPTPNFRRGEYHPFTAAGLDFIYLVSAGANFQMEEGATRLLGLLGERELSHAEMIAALAEADYTPDDAQDLIRELRFAQVIVSSQARAVPSPAGPPADFPLQALVLNITNQCNLACTYC